jgi:hypothetical protein
MERWARLPPGGYDAHDDFIRAAIVPACDHSAGRMPLCQVSAQLLRL